MSAYRMFDLRNITDPDKVRRYRSRVFATVEKHGGHHLVLRGPTCVVEGCDAATERTDG